MACKTPLSPYARHALEPQRDRLTIETNHNQHHVAYRTDLDKALVDHTDVAAKPSEEAFAILAPCRSTSDRRQSITAAIATRQSRE
jgi:superoxide dismutase